jgi:hypothetical protein
MPLKSTNTPLTDDLQVAIAIQLHRFGALASGFDAEHRDWLISNADSIIVSVGLSKGEAARDKLMSFWDSFRQRCETLSGKGDLLERSGATPN